MKKTTGVILAVIAVSVLIGTYFTYRESGAKTYTSERYGFSFQYPAKWQLKEYENYYQYLLMICLYPENIEKDPFDPNSGIQFPLFIIGVSEELEFGSIKEFKDMYTSLVENYENTWFVKEPEIVLSGWGLEVTLKTRIFRSTSGEGYGRLWRGLTIIKDNIRIGAGIRQPAKFYDNNVTEYVSDNVDKEANLIIESFTIE